MAEGAPIGQLSAGDAASRAGESPRPVIRRERAEVGEAGPEIDLEPARTGRSARRLGRAPQRGGSHERARPGSSLQVALGDQLLVGLDDRAPRHPCGDGQLTASGEALLCAEAARAHGVAQRLLKVAASISARPLRQLEQEYEV